MCELSPIIWIYVIDAVWYERHNNSNSTWPSTQNARIYYRTYKQTNKICLLLRPIRVALWLALIWWVLLWTRCAFRGSFSDIYSSESPHSHRSLAWPFISDFISFWICSLLLWCWCCCLCFGPFYFNFGFFPISLCLFFVRWFANSPRVTLFREYGVL